MKLPNLTLKPTPSWRRYQREARARQRRARIEAAAHAAWRRCCAWSYRNRLALGLLLLGSALALPALIEARLDAAALSHHNGALGERVQACVVQVSADLGRRHEVAGRHGAEVRP
jgi:hypothetical protein